MKVTLGETQFDTETFEPKKFIFVDGVKTNCYVNIEEIRDGRALGLDIENGLPPLIVEELKTEGISVTLDEVSECFKNLQS